MSWGFYINGSLKQLITQGKGAPNPTEDHGFDHAANDTSRVRTAGADAQPSESLWSYQGVGA